jgi:hypothetical protein
VLSVPTSSSFTFAYSGAAGTYKFGVLWQVGLAVLENNVIELTQGRHPSSFYTGAGLLFNADGTHDLQYVFRKTLLRENLIRALADNPEATAIRLDNVEGAIVDRNVIDMLNTDPIAAVNSKAVHCFNNQTPSGQVFRIVAGRTGDELTSTIEDAVALSIV